MTLRNLILFFIVAVLSTALIWALVFDLKLLSLSDDSGKTQDENAILVEATIQHEKGNHVNSINILTEAIENKDNDTKKIRALLARAIVSDVWSVDRSEQERVDMYNSSLDHFQASIDMGLDDTYVDYQKFMHAYAVALWHTDQKARAVEIFNNLIESYSLDSTIEDRVYVANYYSEVVNKPAEALSLLKEVETKLMNLGYGMRLMAYVNLMRLSTYYEDYENTEKYANLILSPDLSDKVDRYSLMFAYSHLAEVSGSKKDFENAENYTQIMIGLDGGRVDGKNCFLAGIYAKNGAYDLMDDELIYGSEEKGYETCSAEISRLQSHLGNVEEAKRWAKIYVDYVDSEPNDGRQKNIFRFKNYEEMMKVLAE